MALMSLIVWEHPCVLKGHDRTCIGRFLTCACRFPSKEHTCEAGRLKADAKTSHIQQSLDLSWAQARAILEERLVSKVGYLNVMGIL